MLATLGAILVMYLDCMGGSSHPPSWLLFLMCVSKTKYDPTKYDPFQYNKENNEKIV